MLPRPYSPRRVRSRASASRLPVGHADLRGNAGRAQPAVSGSAAPGRPGAAPADIPGDVPESMAGAGRFAAGVRSALIATAGGVAIVAGVYLLMALGQAGAFL